MIIKVPIYLESDLKVGPDELQDLVGLVQSKFTDDIINANLGRNVSWKFPKGNIKFRILKFAEVISKVSKDKQD